jgi:hypothetical protein
MITPATLANTVRHTETRVREWYEREFLFDRDEVAPLIIQVDEDSDFEEYTSDGVAGLRSWSYLPCTWMAVLRRI